MAVTTVTRSSWTDDSGGGTDGTIINNSELQKIYDAIDQLFSGSGSYATVEFGGNLIVDGVLNLFGFNENAPTVSISANTLSVNMATQNVVPFSFSANITTTSISNIPASGKYGSILWLPTANGSGPFTWSFLTSTVVWDGGGAPTFVTTNNHVMGFLTITVNGGTTWRGINVSANWAS